MNKRTGWRSKRGGHCDPTTLGQQASGIVPRPPKAGDEQQTEIVQEPSSPSPSARPISATPDNVTPEQRAAFDEAATALKPVAQRYTTLQKETAALKRELDGAKKSGQMSRREQDRKEQELEKLEGEMAELKSELDAAFIRLQEILEKK